MSIFVSFKVLGKLFCMFEVFFIGPALVHSPKVLEEDISVESLALEFINYTKTFRILFFPERRMVFG